jgi:drug/metabolite transporter (DMT)-like permease
MSFWLLLAVGGQLINSVVALIDKFVVTSKKVPRPSLYVFYTGILIVFSLLLYTADFVVGKWITGFPSLFNVSVPSIYVLFHAVLSAGFMLVGLYFLYKSLTKADASDVFPVVGSVSAFFVLLFSFIYFDQILHPTFFFGFIFLVVGTLFVSHFRFGRKTFYLTMTAALFLALQSVFLKKTFNEIGFDNGFFWYCASMFFLALLMLFLPSIRKSIFHHRKSKSVKSADKLIIVGKILAGIGGLMITVAIDMGNVTIVQSLGGLQYLFLFLFALFLGKKTHKDLGENVQKKDLLQKAVAMTLILIGFVLLFI